MDKAWDPKKHEEEIYQMWESSGFFNPDNLPGERTENWSMSLPPPNVTGTLHIGHAYETTIQDIATRFSRMRGKRTLWVPGTDHAAIATQAKVEKNIYKEEDKTRHDLGREEFLRRVESFALASQKTILGQLRRIGASLDWSRLAFTLDKDRQGAVFEAFRRMYESDLIYRGHRVVNWDPLGQTTVSDDEVVHKPSKGILYTFRYDQNFPISIATTRPETKMGDTAVAVNPNDKRYAQFVGKNYTAQFMGAELKIIIIADPQVDPDFGTGAVGVTPAHSMTDWELSQRHGLLLKQVINEKARIFNTGTLLDGKKVTQARQEIVEWLKDNNLLEKQEEIDQNINTAERTGATIEPLPKLQWFVSVDKEFTINDSKLKDIPAGSKTTLKKIMRSVVESGEVKIAPEQFEKRYAHWVDNLRDWCISRQIWFGHRIPVWYQNEEIAVSQSSPGDGWTQDEDTLDTWFSSGLWTFSTLGWPQETEDLKDYHPTSLMSPGYEILYLWVSRMIMLSGFLLGEVPFKKALIHGIVRDEQKRKFSKSSGIGGDPLDVIDENGADALRMALVAGVAIGNDPTFQIEKVKGYKHFANKIWNVARFVIQNVEIDSVGFKDYDEFDPEDYSVMRDLGINKDREDGSVVVKKMTEDLENCHIHEAAQTIYHSLWYDFADKYIEHSKEALRGDNKDARRIKSTILWESLVVYLKLLHPFMPFVTEAIWQQLPKKEAKLLMVASWPK